MRTLLVPREVDRLLRYPRGRAMRLARAGAIPFIRLPDGEVRFDATEIEKLLAAAAAHVVAHADQGDRPWAVPHPEGRAGR